ncbi:CCA tRNA nucleotidyltransferase [Paroceanicella profunda]|uniref:CCA tRNA nucleotidyltransferase n=2 Tax=Paroceanicella profunda TaxID=2579971 RepID=A0A5B8G2S4_9RHOB|nr:CCA tRNA nucleotidyltransferase [Paroceanicella profunda]QDL93669.1 CCA tRNA nucleotidyltransferase [Paroceanicella profunda]
MEALARPAPGAAPEPRRGLFVGGCVRNALLGAPVSDIDIATPLPPQEVIARVEAAGLRAVPTGIGHGTVTVVSAGIPHEVTTFRRDVTTDGRHAEVAFTTEIVEDARRRDFTMNALYADASGAVVDPLGGMADLAARRVRFVGEAAARIAEDHLRILRFFRFHAWYGAHGPGLDAEGLAACAAGAAGVEALSRERVGAEMRKLLAAPDPAAALAAMEACGVLARALPGATAAGLPPLLEAEAAAGAAPRWPRRLWVLGGADPATALRLSKAEIRALAALNAAVGEGEPPAPRAFRHGAEAAEDSVVLELAAGLSPVPGWRGEIARGAAAQFPLTAADLMPPLQPGPGLGAALERLRADWLASGLTLSAEALRARL